MEANCPECGLTFRDGKRTLSTFGRPVVTLEQHLAGHAKDSARLAELQASMEAQNALPLVEAHQPDELCKKRCQEAEDAAWIRLPVIAPSRTTMVRAGKTATLADELSAPTRDAFRAHIEKYGAEHIHECAGHYGVNLEVSPLGEYRKERSAIEKRYRKSPTLQARLTKLARAWLPQVRSGLVSELLSGAVTVADVAAEFGVQERTVRGWCSTRPRWWGLKRFESPWLSQEDCTKRHPIRRVGKKWL